MKLSFLFSLLHGSSTEEEFAGDEDVSVSSQSPETDVEGLLLEIQALALSIKADKPKDLWIAERREASEEKGDCAPLYR